MDLATYELTGQRSYEELARVVAAILQVAINQYGDLRLQQIQHRAKHPASLRRKLEKENALASLEVEAVAKDLAGVREVVLV